MANQSNTECIFRCTGNQIVLYDNTCQDCPVGTFSDISNDHTTCIEGYKIEPEFCDYR